MPFHVLYRSGYVGNIDPRSRCVSCNQKCDKRKGETNMDIEVLTLPGDTNKEEETILSILIDKLGKTAAIHLIKTRTSDEIERIVHHLRAVTANESGVELLELPQMSRRR